MVMVVWHLIQVMYMMVVFPFILLSILMVSCIVKNKSACICNWFCSVCCLGRFADFISWWWKGWWLDTSLEGTYLCTKKNRRFASWTSRSQGEVVDLWFIFMVACSLLGVIFASSIMGKESLKKKRKLNFLLLPLPFTL